MSGVQIYFRACCIVQRCTVPLIPYVLLRDDFGVRSEVGCSAADFLQLEGTVKKRDRAVVEWISGISSKRSHFHTA